MLLAADVQRALQAMRRAGQGAGRVAALVGVAVEHEVFLAQGLDHVEHRLEVFVLDNGRHGGAAGGLEVPGSDGEHRLADELDLVDGQQRVTGQQRADVLETRDVLMGDGDAHAFEGVAWGGVDAQHLGVGTVGQARIDVQLVGKLQPVVDVHGLA